MVKPSGLFSTPLGLRRVFEQISSLVLCDSVVKVKVGELNSEDTIQKTVFLKSGKKERKGRELREERRKEGRKGWRRRRNSGREARKGGRTG